MERKTGDNEAFPGKVKVIGDSNLHRGEPVDEIIKLIDRDAGRVQMIALGEKRNTREDHLALRLIVSGGDGI